MDAAADPLRAARPEEVSDKKPAESQDDGYETSNSGEAARRKPSSVEGSPAPPPPAPPDPPEPPYDLMARHFQPPAQPPPQPPPHYRQFEPPQPPQHEYPHHFQFPKYDPYAFKRDADAPYDMSQYGQQKRDEEMYNGIKRECEDPYSFVAEEEMCAMLGQTQQMHHMQHEHQHPHLMHQQQMMLNQPKKRGRKKKIKDENGMEIKLEPGMEGAIVPRPVKERKKHDRFNGMSEEEVSRRTLPDHLTENLDIIIIGINPGLFAAYKGHHYAGPGNHFWKCLYLSGLTREQMSADEDYKLLNFGIGFTNMVPRATKGSADLTRREIKEGSAILLEKLQTFQPKVAVFNGKLIYEVFSGKKDFCFGKQPDTVAGTNTYMWVMPSSSARCAQLPRAADKVPFYAALKKFRDYLNGLLPRLEDNELVFPDTTARRPHEEMEIRRLTTEPEPGDTIILEDGTEVPLKKKRGRPKKVKLENGETAPPTPRAPRAPRAPPSLEPGEQPPKKKRGRPKKIRPEEQQFLMQQQQQQQQQQQAQQQPAAPGMLGALDSAPPYLPQDFELYQPQGEPYFPQHGGGQPANNIETSGGMEAMSGVGGVSGVSGVSGGLMLHAQRYSASPTAGYQSPRAVYHEPGPHSQQQQAACGPQFPGSPAGAEARGGFGSPAQRAFAARSPLYAHSPAAHRYALDSQSQSRAFPHSPSPGGAGVGSTTPFPAASPLHSYTPSPYSQHSSPAPPAAPHYPRQSGSTTSGGSAFTAELSSDVGPALSPAASPPLPLDFEPPEREPERDLPALDKSTDSLSPGDEAFPAPMYNDRPEQHYYGNGVSESPRLEQMHQQHSNMYPGNFNRSTPPGAGSSEAAFSPLAGAAFRPADQHPESQQSFPSSPGEYAHAQAKPKPQDVASKSLSGLESLVDQIPSIADAAPPPEPPPAALPLPEYAPALYPPLPYGAPHYANNGYGVPFGGYGGGWGAGLVRPAPGYLDWQYGYNAPYSAPYSPAYYSPPPPQQTHYLSAPPLLDLHKNAEHCPAAGVPSVPSVGFGGFC